MRLKGLIIIPLLANHFQSYEYGIWSQLLVFLLFVQPLMSWMIEEGFVRKSSGYDLEVRQRNFSSALAVSALNGLFIAAILITMAVPLTSAILKTEGAYQLFFIIGVLDILFISMTNLFREWFLVNQKIFIYSVASFVLALLNIISAVAVVVFDQGVLELIIYKTLSDGFVLMTLFVIYVRQNRFFTPALKRIKQMFLYAVQFVPMVLLATAIDGIDRFFIAHYQGLGDVGVYSLSYGLGTMIILTLTTPFWSTFTSIMTQYYNQDDKKGMQNHFNNAAGTLLLILCPAVVGIFLTSEFIIDFFASDQFSDGALVIGWIACGYMLYMFGSYFKVMVDLVVGPYIQFFVYGAALIANVVGNYMLVPDYGIFGAGISTVIAFALALILNFIISYFHARLAIVKWTFVLKVTISTVFMGGVGVFTQSLFQEMGIAETIAIVVCCAITYGLLIVTMGIVNFSQIKLGAYHLLRKTKQ